MTATAHSSPFPAAATARALASRPLELREARQRRDSLKSLLRTEQAAMAEFLVALADFDRRRGWEALGHASLFAFLRVELRLSNSAAFYRMSAARLLQRFPRLAEPLGEGRLCLSTTSELAKVLTEENLAEVAPRFFGLSAREAQELVAELQPRQAPATRVVVTRLDPRSDPSRSEQAGSQPLLAPPAVARISVALIPTAQAPELSLHPTVVPLPQLLTSEVANGGGERPHAPRDETEPLTADLRRLHITVSRQLLTKLVAAQSGLGHAIPGATMDQVIDAALDLLLEKQARARGLVKKPRAVASAQPAMAAVGLSATGTAAPEDHERPQLPHGNSSVARPEGRAIRRDGPRDAIPAAVRRAVWTRDGGRCCWPLDGGGRCGSTHRLELDHVVPWAEWGGKTEGNLRVVCRAHNRLAARRWFGEEWMRRYAGGGGQGSG
jgi:hypothetical protein